MNLLILLEDEKYLPIVGQLKLNSLAEVEVSNIDFNITNPIKRAEAILFLGDNQSYQLFKEQYNQLLTDKLIFTTVSYDHKLNFEIEVYIANGVIICQLPAVNPEVRSIIIEVTNNIFEGSLKPLISSAEQYEVDINNIKMLDIALNKVSLNSLDVLPKQIVQQVISTFLIKNT